MAKNTSRRAARKLAFRVLYGLNYVPAASDEELKEAFRVSPDLSTQEKYPKGIDSPPEGFAWELIHGVWEKCEMLDQGIAKFSQHWRIERIAKTELTILRLALYEMLERSDVPVKVAINEAIELAKQFGDDNSRSFVNGILDAAAKAIDHGEIGVC